jgi:hypothetical protein
MTIFFYFLLLIRPFYFRKKLQVYAFSRRMIHDKNRLKKNSLSNRLFTSPHSALLNRANQGIGGSFILAIFAAQKKTNRQCTGRIHAAN